MHRILGCLGPAIRHASDGEIDHVADSLVEDADWSIHYIVVGTKELVAREEGPDPAAAGTRDRLDG